jgi:hypothetical protein
MVATRSPYGYQMVTTGYCYGLDEILESEKLEKCFIHSKPMDLGIKGKLKVYH